MAVSKPTASSTFAQIRDWANTTSPGAGDQFISWVQAENNVPPPFIFSISSNTFGPTGFGTSDRAVDWFAAWLTFGSVGPGIARALQLGISGAGKDIPKLLKGVASGIGQIPGAPQLGGLSAIGDFFSKLGQANTWIRVAEVLLGLGLIIVGMAKLGSGTAAGKAALKAGKAAAIL